ncbi:MAG: protein-L-isoaspartate(D-aspartate) O-methyltransferase [Rhodobacteraceae bacterium]|nr:protein-L-isoaspartate(D-aspartate) O-methyltransferase [Paracoccaceae bacterium]
MSIDSHERAELINNVRQHGVTSETVLEALRQVDRKEFVSPTFANRAYEDIALPIARGQTISQPGIVGIMTQALQVEKSHRVLEIGTGSGYQAMVLSYLCRHVYSIERFRSLTQSAKSLLMEHHKRQRVSIIHGDGSEGLSDAAPFDRIIITAAAEEVPPVLMKQLKPDGIMVLPIKRSHSDQSLMQVIRKQYAEDEYNDLGMVRFVPLLEGVNDE